MSLPAIRVEKLSKQYRISAVRHRPDTLRDQLVGLFQRNGGHRTTVFHALQDVSFQVQPGEVVGIIGRNGAGKSTLLKILSRITEPTAGFAKIRGRVGSLLEVGTGFHPELSGRENIYLNGAILGMRHAEIARKFDGIVDFAGVEQFIETPVKRYSSGMYVRLAFAVAAHLESEILLVDEVLAVGDAVFQKKCLGKMESIAHREGRTVLFISHNLPMIQSLCQRVLFLREGKLAADGSCGNIVSHYLADVAELARLPLAERTDRGGAGGVRVTAVEFRNAAGDLHTEPASGQSLTIRLRYACANGQSYKNCRASVVVFKDEAPYFLLSTDLVDDSPLALAGEGWVDFIVPELPLSAGGYALSTYVAADGETQDEVAHAVEFPVVDGDFYGTGRNYPPGWQGRSVLVKHSWRAGR